MKSLEQHKTVGEKLDDLFLQPERLKRNFSYLSIILPMDFSEILNNFEIEAHFIFCLRCDLYGGEIFEGKGNIYL